MGQGSADALHTTVEAIKLAYADRDRYYGDPDFVRVPGEVLLSEPYAAARRGLIDAEAREPGTASRRSSQDPGADHGSAAGHRAPSRRSGQQRAGRHDIGASG